MRKPKDITGRRFGKLVAVKPTEQRLGGSVAWLLQCDCGGQTLAGAAALEAGHIKSCGCLRVERGKARAKDLTGQVFGKLTVVCCEGRTASGDSVWLLRCACGNEVRRNRASLYKGVTDCGCGRQEAYSDKVGQRFGRLTAIGPTKNRDHHRNVLWQFRCDCGGIIEKPFSAVSRGNTRSCGCLRKERGKQWAQENWKG